MATLICRWKLDEGSGATCYDAISGDDMVRNVVGSNPQYVTGKDGPYALLFSGVDGRGFPEFDCPWSTNDMCYIAPTDRAAGCSDAWSMTAWVKTSDSTYGRGIFGTFTYKPDGEDAIGAPHDCLYIGDDGKAYLYVQHFKVATRYTRTAGSTSTIDDGNWHFIVGTYSFSTAHRILKAYVDGALEGTLDDTDTAMSYDTGPIGPGGIAMAIGTGMLLESTVDLYLPGAYLGKPFGAFPGTIDDCRLYCGVLTDQEIEDLYNNRDPARSKIFIFSGGLA
jgi:hypothetical protein